MGSEEGGIKKVRAVRRRRGESTTLGRDSIS